jgi:hypothetical protein
MNKLYPLNWLGIYLLIGTFIWYYFLIKGSYCSLEVSIFIFFICLIVMFIGWLIFTNFKKSDSRIYLN